MSPCLLYSRLRFAQTLWILFTLIWGRTAGSPMPSVNLQVSCRRVVFCKVWKMDIHCFSILKLMVVVTSQAVTILDLKYAVIHYETYFLQMLTLKKNQTSWCVDLVWDLRSSKELLGLKMTFCNRKHFSIHRMVKFYSWSWISHISIPLQSYFR